MSLIAGLSRSSWTSYLSLAFIAFFLAILAFLAFMAFLLCFKKLWTNLPLRKKYMEKHEKNGSVGLSQEWNEMDASQVQWPRSAQHKEIWRTVHLTHSISISFSICHCLFNSFHGVELQRILLHHGKCICHTYLWNGYPNQVCWKVRMTLHEINSRKQNKTKQ